MIVERWRSTIGLAIGLLGLTVVLGNSSVSAQVPSDDQGDWIPLPTALRSTMESGRPTVVLTTSRTSPESLNLRQSLLNQPVMRALAATVNFAEMPVEIYPDRVEALNVQSHPTLLVYGKGSHGLDLCSFTSEAKDAPTAMAWLHSLTQSNEVASNSSESPSLDPEVQPTGGQAAYPTSQVPTPQAVPVPQPAPTYLPQPTPTYQVQQPVAAIPAPSPVYLQTAPPPMVIQQQPQQIIIPPTPPPQVTVLQSVSAPAAAAPTPNQFFVTPTQPQPAQGQPMAGQPQPQPMMAQPMMAQPMMAQPMIAQPQPMAGALQPQQSVVGATAIALLLNNPNFIDRLIGGLGRHLAQRGQPRLQMAPQAPAAMQIPAAGLGAIPMQAGIPLQGQAMQVQQAYPVQAYAQPEQAAIPMAVPYAPQAAYPPPGYYPPPAYYPPYPAPSPQGQPPTPQHKGGLFHWPHKN